ncbi:hypothetical protein HYPSUDRAFT_90261 [Hypholoma sublateritium FD-334 SS-4]|uniref:Uncharacterized protein n=1 Tax=Hypholoma sublateritium (strain FD-334 SS-4) TaxID=945553 RepID=A0A0D2KTX1_HYPSF|nr:hypothetical protein HYPSUDRAFT_90261 [Hypholoma sublateritium FD-334 SS-4]
MRLVASFPRFYVPTVFYFRVFNLAVFSQALHKNIQRFTAFTPSSLALSLAGSILACRGALPWILGCCLDCKSQANGPCARLAEVAQTPSNPLYSKCRPAFNNQETGAWCAPTPRQRDRRSRRLNTNSPAHTVIKCQKVMLLYLRALLGLLIQRMPSPSPGRTHRVQPPESQSDSAQPHAI